MLTRTTITIRECELPMPESREDLKTSLREQVADFLATEDPDAAGNADGDNPHINVTFASDVKNDDKPPLLTATITIRNYELLESCTNDFKDSLREHVANWFRVNVPAADGFAGDQDPDIIITLHTVDDDNRQQLPPTGIAIAPPGRSRAAQEVLLRMYGVKGARAMRPPPPTHEEAARIRKWLEAEGLAEAEDTRGSSVLTPEGARAARAILRYREAELDGLPFELWKKDHDPKPMSLEDFRARATGLCHAPGGETYQTNGYLMLTAPATSDKDDARQVRVTADHMFQPELWTRRVTKPVGYVFENGKPLIAFDQHGLFIDACYYELVLEATCREARWTAMKVRPANPHYRRARGHWQMVRVDTAATEAAAFAAPVILGETPAGIRALLRADRKTGVRRLTPDRARRAPIAAAPAARPCRQPRGPARASRPAPPPRASRSPRIATLTRTRREPKAGRPPRARPREHLRTRRPERSCHQMPQPHRTGPLPPGGELIAMAEAHEAFRVRRREGIAALGYAFVTNDPEQFAWPRSELRGLMVDEASGRILARPFQKFWNAAERGAAGTDWSERHVVLPKLDGSLVYPAGGRWVTRGGITDTSLRAEAVAAAIGTPLGALLERTRTDPADGAPCTPCFEYVGPGNRIVIAYAETRLVLLAVRRIPDGEYWPTARVAEAWRAAGAAAGTCPALDVVRPLEGVAGAGPGEPMYARRLAEAVAAWPAGRDEGVVVAFEPSGHRVKIKSREYVALHRARDDYSSESRVLKVWSDGNRRALIEQLGGERAARLRGYYDALDGAVARQARTVAAEAAAVWRQAGADRKAAAIAWTAATAGRSRVRPLGFTAFGAVERGEDPEAAVRRNIEQLIARASTHQGRIDANVRPMLGPDTPVWRPPDGNRGDAE